MKVGKTGRVRVGLSLRGIHTYQALFYYTTNIGHDFFFFYLLVVYLLTIFLSSRSNMRFLLNNRQCHFLGLIFLQVFAAVRYINLNLTDRNIDNTYQQVRKW